MEKFDRHEFRGYLSNLGYNLSAVEWYIAAKRAPSIYSAIEMGLHDGRLSCEVDKDFEDLLRITHQHIQKTENLLKALCSGLHDLEKDCSEKQKNQAFLKPNMAEISVKLCNCINRKFSDKSYFSNVICETMSDISKIRESEFLEMRGFGKKTHNELLDFMKKTGLKFKEE